MKKVIFSIILTIILLVPVVPVLAQGGFIPCGGYDEAGKQQPECGYYDLLKMINTIIKWIIIVSAPVAAGVMAWAGFMYMTSGVVDQKAAAKRMMWKVLIGFAFILGAWLIVSTLLDALLADSFRGAVPVNFK
jgi:hypothetical protein